MVPLQKIKIANNLFSDLVASESEVRFLSNQLIISDSIISQLRRLNNKYYNDAVKYLNERDMVNNELIVVRNTIVGKEDEITDLKEKLKLANYTSAGLTGACLLVLLVAVI